LIVDSLDNHNLVSSRNLRDITYVSASGVNVYDLLTHERLALTREAASALDKQLAK
jgi:ribosomal protein L4